MKSSAGNTPVPSFFGWVVRGHWKKASEHLAAMTADWFGAISIEINFETFQ